MVAYQTQTNIVHYSTKKKESLIKCEFQNLLYDSLLKSCDAIISRPNNNIQAKEPIKRKEFMNSNLRLLYRKHKQSQSYQFWYNNNNNKNDLFNFVEIEREREPWLPVLAVPIFNIMMLFIH